MSLRRLDRNADGDFADSGGGGDGIFFMATDIQFSVVAVLDDAGVLYERVAYSPYGRAEHRWGGDVNGDGAVDYYDAQAVINGAGKSIGDSGYHPDLDLDRDGSILPYGVSEDITRVQAFGTRAALPTGWISGPRDEDGPDNEVGYAGYRFNLEEQIYCVRFRHYSPRLGRWLERDPAGYVDGGSLYQYVSSNSVTGLDPLGLAPNNASDSACCKQPPLEFFVGSRDTQLADPVEQSVANCLGGHVDIYYGDELIRVGKGGAGAPGQLVVDGVKLELLTRRTKGSLWMDPKHAGPSKPCSLASDADIVWCLRNYPVSKRAQSDTDNCQTDVYDAMKACCVDGYSSVSTNYRSASARCFEWILIIVPKLPFGPIMP